MSRRVSFHQAKPVWERGTEKEKNLTLAFRALVPGGGTPVLRLACSAIYNLYVNGEFVATGPARAAHGFYRMDEISLSAFCHQKQNVILLYVTVSNVHSFYVLNQPGFLCAEILEKGKVLAATGGPGFCARRYGERVQRVPRYSYQRTFLEVYRMEEEAKRMETSLAPLAHPASLEETKPKQFLSREVPYPNYQPVLPRQVVVRGEIRECTAPLRVCHNRCYVGVPQVIDGFSIKELETDPADEVGKLDYQIRERGSFSAKEVLLNDHQYAVYEFDVDRTGLISFEITCRSDLTLYVTMDELLREGFVDYLRLSAINICQWRLKKGRYRLTTLEPYTLRYLCAAVQGGGAVIQDLAIRTICFPQVSGRFHSEKESLNKIYAAAVESFRQNTVDLYTDCPSRERAGWLCDSFFTARVEHALTGNSTVEKNFLENFLLPDRFENLPEGMLPMCYPADFYEESFIPNWAMFYVLELQEYLERSGDRALIDQAEKRLYALMEYFKGFENKEGLLVHLENWIFVEWSDCNQYVQDLNFPTNMLYARTKQAMGALYGDSRLRKEGEALHQTIRRQSYFDGFFHDRAVFDKEHRLRVTDEITETCQYYAFFCGTAAPVTHPALYKRLLEEFGPERKRCNRWEKVRFSNAFIGNYLRLAMLAEHGQWDRLAQEIEAYFLFMAERTGTLWEHDNDAHSCNHGFASHVIVWLDLLAGKKE